MVTYCGHNGIPRGGEDIGAVAALVMCFQFLAEVIPGEL